MDIDPGLIQTFTEESEENIELAEKLLLKMEEEENYGKETISAIFRSIHSFKGGASFFKLNNMVALLHEVETILSKAQHGKLEPNKEILQIILESIDISRQMLTSDSYGEDTDIQDVLIRLKSINNETEERKPSGLHFFDEEPSSAHAQNDKKDVMNRVNLKAQTQVDKSKDSKEKNSESYSAKGKAEKITTKTKKSPVSKTVRLRTELIDNILDQVGEVILVRNQIAKKYPNEDMVGSLSQRITKLHNSILATRMQPVSILFDKFNRIVRDLARNLGKNIVLHIQAGDVELDRSILESFADPLTHLIRNAVDHGLETSEVRIKTGKPVQGNLWIKASQRGGKVEIEVKDDGAGIDLDRVKEKAVEKDLISPEEADEMNDAAAMQLIMMPGFSTKTEASELSGRGVGMDVVKSSIEGAGGTLNIESHLGKGTRFIANFPLTLAITKALIIKAGNQQFAIPEILVEEIASVRWSRKDEVLLESEGKLFFSHRGELIPTVLLSEILRLKEATKENIDHFHFKNIVLCQQNDQSFAVIVDEITSIEDISVKGMPSLVIDCEHFSGLTVLDNGKVSMLLDIPKIGEKLLSHSSAGMSKNKNGSESHFIQGESRREQIIVFTNHSQEFFGIHIDFISEIAQVKSSEIEKIGDTEFFKLHGAHVPIIRLEEYLPISQPEDRENLLVFVSSTNFPIGIVGTKAIKVRNLGSDLNANLGNKHGVLCTLIDDNHMVTILDLFTLFKRRSPEKFIGQEGVGKGLTVLLVEDTAFFRILFTQYLKEQGFEVILASDGLDAIKVYNECKEDIDLLVSDIIMPGIDGIELYERLKRLAADDNRQLPAVAITTISELDYIEKIKSNGYVDCIHKNEKQEFVSCLAEMVRLSRSKNIGRTAS